MTSLLILYNQSCYHGQTYLGYAIQIIKVIGSLSVWVPHGSALLIQSIRSLPVELHDIKIIMDVSLEKIPR